MGLLGNLSGVDSGMLRQCKLALAGGGQHPSDVQCCAGLGWQDTTCSSMSLVTQEF